jgi:2-polyprenyl-3-methyl-5-hydroxy-6-metoxy-1,4-benzoquinol methylase
MIKQLAHNFFTLLGLRVSRLPKSRPPAGPQGGAKYFNTGKLTPLEENSKELYDRFYSDRTALQQYYDKDRLAFYSMVSEHLRGCGMDLDNKDLLDVGCGTGHLMAEIQTWSKPRSLSGCDFADEAMKFSRERFPECRFFTHDINDPLPSTYDIILCTEVFEHLERPFVAIKNLVNAVRPGGSIAITVPNGRLDTSNEHINFWSPESWKAFLERECQECAVKTSLLGNGANFALIGRS